MRRLVLLLLVACGEKDAGPMVCVPDGPYTWPEECDVLDCHAKVCDVTCDEKTPQCGRLDCSNSPQCRLWCQDNTSCEVTDCRGADVCFVVCWSACEVRAEGASECGLECDHGAPCMIHCDPAKVGTSACHFQICEGGSGVQDCGNGAIVCNQPCPAS